MDCRQQSGPRRHHGRCCPAPLTQHVHPARIERYRYLSDLSSHENGIADSKLVSCFALSGERARSSPLRSLFLALLLAGFTRLRETSCHSRLNSSLWLS